MRSSAAPERRRRRASWISPLWDHLTEPSAAVVDRSERRTARLLSAVLLCIAPLGLLSFALQAIGAGGSRSAPWVVLVAVAAIVVAYALSRSRHYRLGGALTTLTPTVGGLLVLASDPTDPGWFAFMALCPALAALLVPLRWSIVLSTVNLVAVVVGVNVVSGIDPDTAIVAVSFNAIMAAVLLTAAAFRDRLERARRADLIARQQLQQSILEGTFGGIAVVRGGVITEANHAFGDLFHRDPDQLVGARIEDLLDVESFGELVRIIEVAEGQTIELSARRRDGSWFDAEVIIRRPGDGKGDGGDDARVVAIRDISDRKRADQTLLNAQRMESVGRLAAGIAHDTNNELFVIMAHADELLSELAAEGRPTDDVRRIQDAAGRVSTLIRRVLLIGRGRAGEAGQIEVSGFLRACCETWQQVLGSGIEVRITGPTGHRFVRMDRAMLEQVLLNLVLNARDAMSDGGVVHVASSRTTIERPNGEPGLDPPDGTYQRITVSDTGGGIDPEHLPQIFDPFFTTKEDELGTGLGLYTSREIVRNAGGAITVASDEVGTTFTVVLPEVEPAQTVADPDGGVARLPTG